jgi:hypothetical protein
MAEFKLSRLKFTWLGAWSSYARYNPDDIVSFGGQSYVCLESHAASNDFYGDLNYYNNDVPPLLVPKWELIASGNSWLGDWIANTYYLIGDIIKRGGSLYICTFAHTSPAATTGDPLGEQAFSVTGVDASNDPVQLWAQYFSSQSWMKDWTVTTYYKINDVVRYGGRIFKCISAHTSAGDPKDGLEASLSDWVTISIVDTWTGNWALDTKYKLNDLVKDGGNVYQCVTSHVSAVDVAIGREGDDSKWALLHNGVQYTGAWVGGIATYKINDVVKYGSYLYQCREFHTAGTTFDLTYWEIYCPGVQFDQEWQGAVLDGTTVIVPPTVYQTGDIVRYGGNLYVALLTNINQNPAVTTAWAKLFDAVRITGEWDQYHPYFPGDVVRRGGNVYTAILDNLNQDPDFFNDDTTTNSVYWELIITGSKWAGIWVPGRTYVSGETVVWVSSSYICQDKHLSDQGNRPDDDYYEDGSTIIGRYWLKVTNGNKINRLKKRGDLRTFGPTQDGSTVGYTTVEIGTPGHVAQTSNGLVTWRPMFETPKVYYVALTGKDDPLAGTSPNAPWRTLRYALENVTGYATINVRTGVFEEVLPLRVPAFVAVQGDELRSTVIKPANGLIDQTYYDQIIAALEYISTISGFIVRNIPIGADDPITPETLLYGEVPQDFTAGAATTDESLIITSLISQIVNRLETFSPVSIAGSNSLTSTANRLKAYATMTNNKAFIKNEATLYIDAVFNDSTAAALPERWSGDLDRIIDSITYDIGYVGNYKSVEASTYFINAFDYGSNKTENMFLLRDGTGLRNMTLVGLDGTLGELSIYLTRRPSAGAYASLDPGWGPSDTTVWVGSKSPYIQNVTTFGTACVGLKVDGDIHGGGNQTIVSNDFTQILSDGIGVWCNGAGRTEVVSVFTYYCHISYLCTAGGKIRGTNGNSSYGTYGAVSEGYSTTENPITATVNNRYYQADVAQTLIGANGDILKVFYSDAGVNYTNATYNLVGAGNDAVIVGDDFRDGAVYEVRIVTAMDSTIAGGSSYMFNTNTSQGGDDISITLAGSNENTAAEYRTLRLLISSGTGTGQYGYIAEYDDVGKVVYIGKESKASLTVVSSTTGLAGSLYTLTSVSGLAINDRVIFTGTKFGNIQDFTTYYIKTIDTGTKKITLSLSSGGATYSSALGTGTMTLHFVGWEHIVPGTTILSTLDKSSNYSIEPRVTFSSPGFSAAAGGALPTESQWLSVASNDTVYVAVGLALNTAAYSTDGQTWLTSSLPYTGLWSRVRYVNGQFIAFAELGKAARSVNGLSWSAITMPRTDVDWRDVTYGNGKYVAIANGGTAAATSTDGITWTPQTLPEGAEWNSIKYGKGKFVVAAQSDSTITNLLYSTTGLTGSWTIGSVPSGIVALAYGNNRFVAIAGGYIGANTSYTSVDGVTWSGAVTIPTANWQDLTYGQGLFMAVATGTNTVITSQDGITWTTQSIPSTGTWSSVTFANINKPGKFLIVAGGTGNSTATMLVTTGVTAQARVYVVGSKISQVRLWDTGSGYTSTPVITLTDPNNVNDVSLEVRRGNGVLGVPTIQNGGTGYAQTSTTITITGNGYKDQYQIGSFLVVDGLTRIPGPGDNVSIGGINDYTYKLLNCLILGGSLGNYTARLNIGKDLNIEESPEHGIPVSIRQFYSQVRLTGHDFLDVGLGNFIQTNYPNTLFPNGTVVSPQDEVQEANGGRVFYTTTDQDGNFRVGELFAVEQSTGIVTLNAQFFELQGLEELRLGGIVVGGTGVVVREFSTDVTFTADSNNVVPTQKAIKAYIQRRVSGGGADAITGGLTAGVVQVGSPDRLTTTDGSALIFRNKVNMTGGIDGDMLVLAYFTSSGA